MTLDDTVRIQSLSVRPLVADDAPRWGELWNGYLEFYGCTLSAEVTEHTWRRLIDASDQPHGLVAVDAGDRVLGFAIYHFHLSTWAPGGYCYLEDLFVDPAGRGKGAGYALVEAVYRAAANQGAARVYWVTQADNSKAQSLYDRVAERTSFVQYRWTPAR